MGTLNCLSLPPSLPLSAGRWRGSAPRVSRVAGLPQVAGRFALGFPGRQWAWPLLKR